MRGVSVWPAARIPEALMGPARLFVTLRAVVAADDDGPVSMVIPAGRAAPSADTEGDIA